jgi:hypothetical protein
MTDRRIRATQPDLLDVLALAEIDQSNLERVKIARARAEKWIAGLTALVGLTGTAVVIKGPDSIAKVSEGARAGIATLLVGAFISLAYATFQAYRAAFGDPTHPESIPREPLNGLHGRLLNARIDAESRSVKHLGQAIQATFIGIALIITAIGVSWFSLAPSSGAASTCVYGRGPEVLMEVDGVLSISELERGLEIRPCPE